MAAAAGISFGITVRIQPREMRFVHLNTEMELPEMCPSPHFYYCLIVGNHKDRKPRGRGHQPLEMISCNNNLIPPGHWETTGIVDEEKQSRSNWAK